MVSTDRHEALTSPFGGRIMCTSQPTCWYGRDVPGARGTHPHRERALVTAAEYWRTKMIPGFKSRFLEVMVEDFAREDSLKASNGHA